MNINPGTGLPAAVFSPVLMGYAGFLFSIDVSLHPMVCFSSSSWQL